MEENINKVPLKTKNVFIESCYNENQYVEHHCDDVVGLNVCPLDRPFDQMRRDLYFNDNYWSKNTEEMIQSYINNKNKMKDLNKQLHEFFTNNGGKGIKLEHFLEKFNCIKFTKHHKAFNVKIYYAKFLYFDGNAIEVLCKGDNLYYIFNWGGS